MLVDSNLGKFIEFDVKSSLNPDKQFFLKHICFDKKITKAKGHYLYDEHGNKYLDFLAQFGAIPFGHNPDFLWHKLTSLKDKNEPSFTQPLISPAAEELANRLIKCAPSGIKYLTFTNSGAESVEAAIKIARSKTKRPVILSAKNSYHGKTLGAVSATGNQSYKVPFLTDTTCFEQVTYGDCSALEERLSKHDVAAFIVEPIQGEGGMVCPPAGYLRSASEICKKTQTLFILDEVQTGLGRTGYLFASEYDDLQPDVILLAKALGGGLFPLGACLCSQSAWTSDFGKYHSSTFANNNLTCSIGLSVLEHLLMDNSALIHQVKAKGEYLGKKLQTLVDCFPEVFESVDGRGLMYGIKLRKWSGDTSYVMMAASYTGNAVPLVCGYLLNECKILTLPTLNTNNVLRIEPSLTIKKNEIDRLLHSLENVADMLKREDYASLLSYTIEVPAKALSPIPKRSFSTDKPRKTTSTTKSSPVGKFAFLMHPTSLEDLIRALPSSMSCYSRKQKEQFSNRLFDWAYKDLSPGICYHLPYFDSEDGGYIEGWLIACLLKPEQIMRLRPRQKKELIQKYIKIANQLEVDVVGLGAFTSVITGGGANLGDEKRRFKVTTGNSLTAMASVESIVNVCKSRSINLLQSHLGVIGATGSIGRLICKSLFLRSKKLLLYGNSKNPQGVSDLEALGGELYKSLLSKDFLLSDEKLSLEYVKEIREILHTLPKDLLETDSTKILIELYQLVNTNLVNKDLLIPIDVTTNLRCDLCKAKIIVSATSNGSSFVKPEYFSSGSIVFDTARPNDVLPLAKDNKGSISLYEAGLVSFPKPIQLGTSNVVGLPRGVSLGCLAETMILTKSRIKKDFSIGRKIPLNEARLVSSLAHKQGFKPFELKVN